MARWVPSLLSPCAAVVDEVVTSPWLRAFLDLECFILSGMTSKDTICAGAGRGGVCVCVWVGGWVLHVCACVLGVGVGDRLAVRGLVVEVTVRPGVAVLATRLPRPLRLPTPPLPSCLLSSHVLPSSPPSSQTTTNTNNPSPPNVVVPSKQPQQQRCCPFQTTTPTTNNNQPPPQQTNNHKPQPQQRWPTCFWSATAATPPSTTHWAAAAPSWRPWSGVRLREQLWGGTGWWRYRMVASPQAALPPPAASPDPVGPALRAWAFSCSPAGIEKHGGRVLLRTHVEEVVVEGGRAAGVRLRSRAAGGTAPVIRARKAVVSNASVWDTLRLLPEGGLARRGAACAAGQLCLCQPLRCLALPCLPLAAPAAARPRHGCSVTYRCACPTSLSPATHPPDCPLSPSPASPRTGAVPQAYRQEGQATPRTGSFVHLHLGIDAAGLPPNLDIHHLIVNSWADIEVGGGAALISSHVGVCNQLVCRPGAAAGAAVDARAPRLLPPLLRGSSSAGLPRSAPQQPRRAHTGPRLAVARCRLPESAGAPECVQRVHTDRAGPFAGAARQARGSRLHRHALQAAPRWHITASLSQYPNRTVPLQPTPSFGRGSLSNNAACIRQAVSQAGGESLVSAPCAPCPLPSPAAAPCRD